MKRLPKAAVIYEFTITQFPPAYRNPFIQLLVAFSLSVKSGKSTNVFKEVRKKKFNYS